MGTRSVFSATGGILALVAMTIALAAGPAAAASPSELLEKAIYTEETVGDLDEAIRLANSSIFGLGSSIWTRDLDRASYAAERLEAGYTWINSPQKIYDELPFGGVKQSGQGKEHGIEALDYYMETKSVVIKRSS